MTAYHGPLYRVKVWFNGVNSLMITVKCKLGKSTLVITSHCCILVAPNEGFTDSLLLFDILTTRLTRARYMKDNKWSAP